MRWPDEYGYLLRTTTAVSPRWTSSETSASSEPSASSQNTHPGCSPACVTYSSRQGAHSGFVTRRLYQAWDAGRVDSDVVLRTETRWRCHRDLHARDPRGHHFRRALGQGE